MEMPVGTATALPKTMPTSRSVSLAPSVTAAVLNDVAPLAWRSEDPFAPRTLFATAIDGLLDYGLVQMPLASSVMVREPATLPTLEPRSPHAMSLLVTLS